MPLQHYGVLKGRVTDTRREDGQDTPHYQIQVSAGGTEFRVAVNVKSQTAPSDLLYVIREQFQHPLLASLPALSEGFSSVPSEPGGIALDFIRDNLFRRADMVVLPPDLPGPDNDLSDRLAHFAGRAQAEPGALIYAFGQRWGPEVGVPDKIFGFSPGNGVHDIHMNQGNVGQFTRDDGVWQDGGLLLFFPASQQWVGIFLAFQSQGWHTDDHTGHTLPDLSPSPGARPGPREPDGQLRIVAALLGPAGGRETVTLLNTSAAPVDLIGWTLRNRAGQRQPLSGQLGAGEAVRVRLDPGFALSNRGDTLSLLSAAGLKVDGVAFTAQDAGAEGRTVVFR